MNLEHVAIWTGQPEELKSYYCRFFGGISNEKYFNPIKNFTSYFISFQNGARLEIMSRPDIPVNLNDPSKQYTGIIHLSFDPGTVADVDAMADLIRQSGYPILSGPRKTGDGYYEFETYDPDCNRIEVGTLFR